MPPLHRGGTFSQRKDSLPNVLHPRLLVNREEILSDNASQLSDNFKKQNRKLLRERMKILKTQNVQLTVALKGLQDKLLRVTGYQSVEGDISAI